MLKDKEENVVQDLHVQNVIKMEKEDDVIPVANSTGFEAMREEDLWFGREEDNFLNLNDSSRLYNDFPLLDFPCMSSSSSSSPTPVTKNQIATTSSCSSATSSSHAAASWAHFDLDAEETRGGNIQFKMEPTTLSSAASMEFIPPADCSIGNVDSLDLMQDYGYMGLIDGSEIWDTSTVIQTEENPRVFHEAQQYGNQNDKRLENQEENVRLNLIEGDPELSVILFQWLKQHRDQISAEDMRNIRLKRSTIEYASNRLGSTKEGRKQLLKLILRWVEQSQLQKKSGTTYQKTPQTPYLNPYTNPNYLNSNFNHICASNAGFSSSLMHPSPPHYFQVSISPHSAAVYAPSPGNHGFPVPSSIAQGNQVVKNISYMVTENFQALPAQYNHFSGNTNIHHGICQPQASHGCQFPSFRANGEGMLGTGSSASKKARKNRMVHQRRLRPHFQRHQNNQCQLQSEMNDQSAKHNEEDMTGAIGSPSDNWTHWPAITTSPHLTMEIIQSTVDASRPHTLVQAAEQASICLRSAAPSQEPGWKPEKNLKLLLQKVLKQSDVGNLGRIVLPKKEAERNLPELESGDGICISLEDIGTSRVWTMRYKFWPNNKSRMYLLENTGEFVKANGLQEGDVAVIYLDTQISKYIIRGVKVQQSSIGKKPGKRNLHNLSLAPNDTSLAPGK